MKLNYINDIAETCNAFMQQVIDRDELLDYKVLMARLNNVMHDCTEHDDDTIDIDYGKMCFTVHLDRVHGQWKLCENASYYVYEHGFLDVVDGVIDVELF